MQLYADLFKENHITGKRLLLLTESDMRDMGVKSKGHVMHLKARHGGALSRFTGREQSSLICHIVANSKGIFLSSSVKSKG